jgi:hypothetical protein
MLHDVLFTSLEHSGIRLCPASIFGLARPSAHRHHHRLRWMGSVQPQASLAASLVVTVVFTAARNRRATAAVVMTHLSFLRNQEPARAQPHIAPTLFGKTRESDASINPNTAGRFPFSCGRAPLRTTGSRSVSISGWTSFLPIAAIRPRTRKRPH